MKSAAKSKGVSGAVGNFVGMLVLAAYFAGIPVDEETQVKMIDAGNMLIMSLMALWQIGTALLAGYGRIAATEKIGLTGDDNIDDIEKG